MGWFKKSQLNEVTLIKNILDKYVNGPPEYAIEEIQLSVEDPCPILSIICNEENMVPPFYMNVFSLLCGAVANEKEKQVQEYSQELSPTQSPAPQ